MELPKSRSAPVQAKRYGRHQGRGSLRNRRWQSSISRNLFQTSVAADKRGRAKNLTFIPALLPIQVGTRVVFPSLDDTYHSIFSYSPVKRFDLGRYRPEERPIPSVVFDQPGLVMSAMRYSRTHARTESSVLKTPYFVVTDTDGRFRLINSPRAITRSKPGSTAKPRREKPVHLKWPNAECRLSMRRIRQTKRRVGVFAPNFRRDHANRRDADCAWSLSRTAESRGGRRAGFAGDFQAELSSLHKTRRIAPCRARRPLQRAGREAADSCRDRDNALDLLYPSAKDELRDLMEGDEPPPEQAARSLHARFYRFLDNTGAVIKPPNASDVGELDAKAELDFPSTSCRTRSKSAMYNPVQLSMK